MAFTQSDVDALKAAIAKGVRRVQYQDKLVVYHSLAEMLQVLRRMEEELGLKVRSARLYAESDKGLK